MLHPPLPAVGVEPVLDLVVSPGPAHGLGDQRPPAVILQDEFKHELVLLQSPLRLHHLWTQVVEPLLPALSAVPEIFLTRHQEHLKSYLTPSN